MTQFIRYSLTILLISLASCQQVLEPKPTTLLVDDLVLNEPNDVQPVRIGLYNGLRGMSSPNIMAGDFMSDYIQANGTFTDNIEFGTKRVTSTNGIVDALWLNIYQAIYVANFMLEKLPAVSNVPESTRKLVTAEARFIRGWANFIGVYTFGDIPQVKTTDPVTNRTVPRVAKATILASVLEDYQAALADLPNVTSASTNATNNATYLNKVNCRAAMARYYLYLKNWAQAEDLSTQVINSGVYKLDSAYANVITKDFISESILEVGYNLSDDPGTSATSLNNLLVGRREIIPSNQYVSQMITADAGTRRETITFNAQQQRGNDNGWTVRKYGTASEDNNNIVLIRLAEMYLIRAEARAQQNKLSGASGAIADLNVLRKRAKAPAISVTAQADVVSAVERERIYELSFEGHRWYDLVRTGRAQAVMSAFSPNWTSRFELWPIPQREIQQNTALTQNPGY